MKKHATVAPLLALWALACSAPNDPTIEGVWRQVTSTHEPSRLEFRSDGTFTSADSARGDARGSYTTQDGILSRLWDDKTALDSYAIAGPKLYLGALQRLNGLPEVTGTWVSTRRLMVGARRVWENTRRMVLEADGTVSYDEATVATAPEPHDSHVALRGRWTMGREPNQLVATFPPADSGTTEPPRTLRLVDSRTLVIEQDAAVFERSR